MPKWLRNIIVTLIGIVVVAGFIFGFAAPPDLCPMFADTEPSAWAGKRIRLLCCWSESKCVNHLGNGG